MWALDQIKSIVEWVSTAEQLHSKPYITKFNAKH